MQSLTCLSTQPATIFASTSNIKVVSSNIATCPEGNMNELSCKLDLAMQAIHPRAPFQRNKNWCLPTLGNQTEGNAGTAQIQYIDPCNPALILPPKTSSLNSFGSSAIDRSITDRVSGSASADI